MGKSNNDKRTFIFIHLCVGCTGVCLCLFMLLLRLYPTRKVLYVRGHIIALFKPHTTLMSGWALFYTCAFPDNMASNLQLPPSILPARPGLPSRNFGSPSEWFPSCWKRYRANQSTSIRSRRLDQDSILSCPPETLTPSLSSSCAWCPLGPPASHRRLPRQAKGRGSLAQAWTGLTTPWSLRILETHILVLSLPGGSNHNRAIPRTSPGSGPGRSVAVP